MTVQHHQALRAVVGLSLVLAAGLFSACDRKDDERTAGQKLDDAVKKAEIKSDELKADAQAAGKGITAAAASAADGIALKERDVAITTQVNVQLARDERLSALRINVDTTAGRVLLKGTAPDAASRDRATTLAQAVEGVLGVDNELTINPSK
jgi:hyperosmotically inducible periplasmic protein